MNHKHINGIASAARVHSRRAHAIAGFAGPGMIPKEMPVLTPQQDEGLSPVAQGALLLGGLAVLAMAFGRKRS